MSSVKPLIDDINKALAGYLEPRYPEKIYEAMGYSVMAGGKRLRPVLLLLACRAAGGDDADAMPFACAMEMIHTYSLIHDDLPAMDNDDLRRGRPTCHKQFDEATAILAGDCLLGYAFETMLAKASENFDAKYVKAMKIIADYSGTKGMLVGQVVDVDSEGKKISAETLEFIHRHKTGGLIKAALMAGGIIGGADEKTTELLKAIGEDVGLAFQIKDDLLDVTSTAEVLGKPILSDEKNEKVTYVSLYGIEKAQAEYLRITDNALENTKKLGETAKPLYDYIASLTDRIN
ncbi:MAG: polyprenyl synthetase family protein [Firmicutes bacterium]|nr:polyprenyl synthetase family protein [Bacillota bacterium]MBQ9605233.1 polyprenyl synthetase family protein [Bacillota bacterium]